MQRLNRDRSCAKLAIKILYNTIVEDLQCSMLSTFPYVAVIKEYDPISGGKK